MKGFNGAKTGITEAAGPCLAATYEKDENNFSVVLLQSNSMDCRWQEAIRLTEWAINRKQMLKPSQHNTIVSSAGTTFHNRGLSTTQSVRISKQ